MFFEDIQAFVAVVRAGSFSAAAIELYVAQSALSRRVKRLEGRMGARLLVRHARGIQLTEEGAAFLTRAGRLVDEVAHMERDLSAIVEEPVGTVRVALPQRSSGLLGPRVFARTLVELPKVQLELLEGTPANIHAWLSNGEADIALSYSDDVGPSYEVLPVLTEPLHLIATPGLLQQTLGPDLPAKLSMQALARLPLVLPKRPHIVRVVTERLCAQHGVKPHIILETDGIFTSRGIVEMGLAAMVFGLSSSLSSSMKEGRTVAVPFQAPQMAWRLYLAKVRAPQHLVAVNRVHQLLLQELDALVAQGAWAHAKRIMD